MQTRSDPFKPPLFFVVNGSSGRQDCDATCETIKSTMQAAARKHQIFIIPNAYEIKETIQSAIDAAQKESGVVVAVGGDGTINAVAGAALASSCLFGAVPRGTFNYFGRTHGIPEELDGALEDLLQGNPTPVQVGYLNDHVFLVNASVGLYPELLEDREVFKRRYGRSRLVALWSAVVTALGDHRYLDITLEQNGKQVDIRTTTLFIGNNRLQLEQVGMHQAAAVQAGHLAAIAVSPVGTMALLWLAARGAIGKLADADNVVGFSFRSLTVVPLGLWRGRQRRPARRIKVALDGEIMWMECPLTFRVGPDPLMLMKPPPAEPASNDEFADPVVDGLAAVLSPSSESTDGRAA